MSPTTEYTTKELTIIERERAHLREVRVRPRTVRELVAMQDEAATLLATMYEIGGMAVVA
jgi:hypothetical protein